MKASGRDAQAWFRRPDPAVALALLHGADPMRVALRRQDAVRALAGPGAEAEMRVARLSGADLRADPAALLDAAKAQGFFPGPRVVVIDEATDGLADTVAALLEDWAEGDANVVATAGALKPGAKLRKLAEGHRRALCIGIYDDPPTREEIGERLRAAGLAGTGREALAELEALAHGLEPGDFRQTLDRIALYKLDDPSPLTPGEVRLLAPPLADAAVDELVDAVADGAVARVPALLARLRAQGVTAVGIAIGAERHFRRLHAVACDPEGPARGVGRLRPPPPAPRRERMGRQAQHWGARRLEAALALLFETDLALRSSAAAPDMALVERALMRVAGTAAR